MTAVLRLHSNDDDDDERMLFDAAMRYADLGSETLRRRLADGRIASERNADGRYVIRKSDIDRYLASNPVRRLLTRRKPGAQRTAIESAGRIAIERLHESEVRYRGDPVWTPKAVSWIFGKADKWAAEKIARDARFEEGRHLHRVTAEELAGVARVVSDATRDHLPDANSLNANGYATLLTPEGVALMAQGAEGEVAKAIGAEVNRGYFHGETVAEPAASAPMVTLQHLEHIADAFGRRLEPHFSAIRGEVRDLGQTVVGVVGRLEAVERAVGARRRDFTKATKLLWLRTLGPKATCPCCFGSRCGGALVTNQDGSDYVRELVDFDHWHLPSENGRYNGWPVCKICNQLLQRGSTYKSDHSHAFATFVHRVKERESVEGRAQRDLWSDVHTNGR